MNLITLKPGKPGKVYLIGAGPGDPDLITVRGLMTLRDADVIVYDRLANPVLLKEARSSAELIYVGKAAGKPSISQYQINRILVDKALEGKKVARLKGGDPFVFGRGGEELEILAKEGIPFEVVPGISSSISAAAFAGIPLTHRDYSSSFTVITGHSIHANSFSQNWHYLAQCETLVILMGFKHLKEITERLINHGRSRETPAAVIEKASYQSQQVVTGTLSNIIEKTKELSGPATVVVGEVVKLNKKLSWFEPNQLINLEEVMQALSFG